MRFSRTKVGERGASPHGSTGLGSLFAGCLLCDHLGFAQHQVALAWVGGFYQKVLQKHLLVWWMMELHENGLQQTPPVLLARLSSLHQKVCGSSTYKPLYYT